MSTSTSQRPSTSTPQPPDVVFRSGRSSASIWSTESTTKDGRTVLGHSVRIQKRLKDEKTGEWKSTEYYYPDELPRLILVALKAYEHAMLRREGLITEGDGGFAEVSGAQGTFEPTELRSE